MLAPRQARFVDEYLRDRDATAAAMRAGYSERSAYVMGARLLRRPDVQLAMESRRRGGGARKLPITRDDCIRALVEAYKVARAARDGSAMVGAIRELNRICGFYVQPPVCGGSLES